LRLVFGQAGETVLAASSIFSLVLGFALRGLVTDILMAPLCIWMKTFQKVLKAHARNEIRRKA